ncbi:Ubiquinone biosynthesis protein [Geranomyces michiganensis]|nr:Ubiquinone biosynthesis protein [Geranomyces michiganensis]
MNRFSVSTCRRVVHARVSCRLRRPALAAISATRSHSTAEHRPPLFDNEDIHRRATPRRSPGILERTWIAASSAIGAMRDPTRQETVAYLGEATSPFFIEKMRDRMLVDATGRRILRQRPLINSQTLDLSKLRLLDTGTFGREYVRFLDSEGVSPDTRVPVKYIGDDELAYVMQRYREVHDFWHTLTGLPTTIEAELGLKWLELVQTGLPVAALSAFVGPLRLTSAERERLFAGYVPWAVQCGASCKFLLNIYYEEHMDRQLDELRKELGFLPLPDNI